MNKGENTLLVTVMAGTKARSYARSLDIEKIKVITGNQHRIPHVKENEAERLGSKQWGNRRTTQSWFILYHLGNAPYPSVCLENGDCL